MNAVAQRKEGAALEPSDLRRFDLRRLMALVTKESYQALRDPSTLLIAFVLPVVLLLLFERYVWLKVTSTSSSRPGLRNEEMSDKSTFTQDFPELTMRFCLAKLSKPWLPLLNFRE